MRLRKIPNKGRRCELEYTYIIGDWCPSHLETPPSVRIPREMTHFVGLEVMTLANIYVYYARLVSPECHRFPKYLTHSQTVTRKQFDRELLRIRQISRQRKRRKNLTASGHFKICLTNWKYRRHPLANNVNSNTVYTYFTDGRDMIIHCRLEPRSEALSRLDSGSNLATTFHVVYRGTYTAHEVTATFSVIGAMVSVENVVTTDRFFLAPPPLPQANDDGLSMILYQMVIRVVSKVEHKIIAQRVLYIIRITYHWPYAVIIFREPRHDRNASSSVSGGSPVEGGVSR